MCPSPDRSAASTRVASRKRNVIMTGIDHASACDLEPLTAHERAIVGVVTQLRAGVDGAPITALVRDGGEALERVREALAILGDLDPQLLVRVALDALVCAHADDRGAR